jgi:hypothetical protein
MVTAPGATDQSTVSVLSPFRSDSRMARLEAQAELARLDLD